MSGTPKPTGETCPKCENDKLVFRLEGAHPRFSRIRRCNCCAATFTVPESPTPPAPVVPAPTTLNGVTLGPNSPLVTKSGRKRYLGPSEHHIQATYIAAIHLRVPAQPELKTLHAIPNSVGRDKATQAKRKAEGVVPGMPDVHWPVSRGPFVGFWIEFKRPGESVPRYQYDIHERLRAQGHCVIVMSDAQDAFDATMRYAALEPGHRTDRISRAIEENRVRGL